MSDFGKFPDRQDAENVGLATAKPDKIWHKYGRDAHEAYLACFGTLVVRLLIG